MAYPEVNMRVESAEGSEEMSFPIQRLICAGWVGRDPVALQEHIDELAELGVPAPTRIPIYMNFSPYLVTNSDVVDVVSTESSGEVEYVVLKDGDRLFIGVGSDHTDRGFEKYSIPASKQMYAKVLAPIVWPYEEVQGHWNKIIVRSWTSTGGTRTLYQQAELASILNVEELLSQLPTGDGLTTEGFVLFSGTPATLTGLAFGDAFDFEMEDPVMGRRIRHGYQVRVLPQYN